MNRGHLHFETPTSKRFDSEALSNRLALQMWHGEKHVLKGTQHAPYRNIQKQHGTFFGSLAPTICSQIAAHSPLLRFKVDLCLCGESPGMSPARREYCDTIRIEIGMIRTLMKVVRTHQSAEELRRELTYSSCTYVVWNGSYMVRYAWISRISIQRTMYDILPDPQGSTLPNKRNICSRHSSTNLEAPLPVSFTFHTHLPKGGKEVSE